MTQLLKRLCSIQWKGPSRMCHPKAETEDTAKFFLTQGRAMSTNALEVFEAGKPVLPAIGDPVSDRKRK